jgi:DNA-binding MarR family transcriptional regulator
MEYSVDLSIAVLRDVPFEKGLLLLKEHGFESLTNRQLRVLLYLDAHPKSDFGEIAAALNIPKPSVTRILEVLRLYGMVECIQNPSDKRKVIITLHPAPLSLERGAACVA